MAGKLITLPLRVWFRSARLLTRAGVGVAERAVSLAGQTLGRNGSSTDHGAASAAPGWREDSIEQPVSPVDVEHPHEQPERRPAPTQPRETVHVSEQPEPVHVSEEPEPVHVSEEPELVREEAEPGAEDGAGAQLTVMEPWNGYARMNAREVIARAEQADAAELAAVRLYESRHRSRQTVLATVDRRLKLASGPNRA
ncbi:MAG TPA: hypothetical protein VJU80_10275 [Solirubrobacteraceae bacterium]|nr:hypothetical protein [Solirubrobacteraceae bacterium]